MLTTASARQLTSSPPCRSSNLEVCPLSKTVSLIIVNYNACECIVACVSSALSQVDEVIVVDNASSDDSLAQLEAAFPYDSKVQIIRNYRNLGFAAACNIGAEASTGSCLFFLNPDCVLTPDSVSHLLRVLDDCTDVGMAGGLLVNPDGTEQAGGRRAIPTPWRSFVRAFGLSRFANRWPRLFFDFHLHTQPLPAHPIEVEAISGACMLIRRAAMQDVGHWDEGYFLHCEDLDFSMTLRRKGWKIMFVPDARVVHYKGSCSRARPIFVEWHKHCGMMRFYRKFFQHQYPGPLMWLVALGIWLRFGLVATYHSALRILR
ncbi:glycosyltransferase family 2 protein [Candidatus Nitrospira nitrificans]|uniref:dTDP-Rha:A-D-GlcNAc-diphosphoryl polyprenol, A-3-L-rhamnosyl transferase WbbL n=1 Tax=Candidatus Nitrospira nitrificans TaxID=1742973 RepID=A0A0S4LJJ8_9BACT|nr:glycosyltransferase family 2 protein [Candidatus Nitrospira nitrificans]CUS36075.1 dTDP-Rha:A-D-GlcNAc-diphosphoryl polyprenol, A-3-L-rhamnosyl transferase WbbL [Candidatus Nitrospira nitrificans]